MCVCTVVKIPKTCILSAKSTGVANILEDEAIEGGAALSIAVMYELAQGTESPWYGYLQALPFSEDLPIFWSEAEKMLFQGTELEDVVFNDQVCIQCTHQQLHQVLTCIYIRMTSTMTMRLW